MMKKLVGNIVSVLIEVFMWVTFIGCVIGGLYLGYKESGVLGAVGGLVLGAIVGMLLNIGWWLISTFQEIRNYSKKWLGKYKAEPDSSVPMQMPDFHFPPWLLDNGKKIIISLISLALLAGIVVIAKNFVSSRTKEEKVIYKEAEKVEKRGMVATIVSGSFTDPRDNQIYKTVKIGSQIWIAENLNYDVSGSKCYNNDTYNCQRYGRLYNWSAALKACPSGWHLPSNSEWDALYRLADGTNGTSSPYKSETAGEYLKAKNGWNENGNGTDDYGFAALPGGLGNADGRFSSLGNYGNWWSGTEYDDSRAYNHFKSYKHNNAGWETEIKSKFFSVRCLQGSRGESVSATPGKYPQGSERLLTDSDLQGISKSELRIMRNEIFARHGYIFKSDDLKEHFGNQSWYSPKYADVNSMLTNIEQKNVRFILSYE